MIPSGRPGRVERSPGTAGAVATRGSVTASTASPTLPRSADASGSAGGGTIAVSVRSTSGVPRASPDVAAAIGASGGAVTGADAEFVSGVSLLDRVIGASTFSGLVDGAAAAGAAAVVSGSVFVGVSIAVGASALVGLSAGGAGGWLTTRGAVSAGGSCWKQMLSAQTNHQQCSKQDDVANGDRNGACRWSGSHMSNL